MKPSPRLSPRSSAAFSARTTAAYLIAAVSISACGGGEGESVAAQEVGPTLPLAIGEPEHASVAEPSAASFVVPVTPLNQLVTVQWQLSTDGGASWASISGAVDSTYMTPPTKIADSRNTYRAIVNATSRSATTGAATLTVYPPASKPWKTPEPISAGIAPRGEPQVAMDEAGNAIATWAQWTGSANGFVASRYSASTGAWSTPAVVHSKDGDGDGPQIKMDASGNAIAVWAKWNRADLSFEIWTSRYSASSGVWTAATVIASGSGAHSPVEAGIAMDAAGNAIVIWQLANGPRVGDGFSYYYYGDVVASRYSVNAGTWSPATVIDAGSGRGSSPRIAMDAKGNAIAIWEQLLTVNGPGHEIIANRFNVTTGAWVTPASISSVSTFAWQASSRLAMNAAGDAVAVWNSSTGVSTNRYSANSGWSTAKGIDGTQGSYSVQDLAMSAGGSAIVVALTQQHESLISLLASYSASNGVWDTATAIAASVGNKAPASSRVAVDALGNALVVWRLAGRTSAILSRRYSASSGTWDSEVAIGTVSGLGPRIASNPSGACTVVWSQTTSSGQLVHANRYE